VILTTPRTLIEYPHSQTQHIHMICHLSMSWCVWIRASSCAYKSSALARSEQSSQPQPSLRVAPRHLQNMQFFPLVLAFIGIAVSTVQAHPTIGEPIALADRQCHGDPGVFESATSLPAPAKCVGHGNHFVSLSGRASCNLCSQPLITCCMLAGLLLRLHEDQGALLDAREIRMSIRCQPLCIHPYSVAPFAGIVVFCYHAVQSNCEVGHEKVNWFAIMSACNYITSACVSLMDGNKTKQSTASHLPAGRLNL